MYYNEKVSFVKLFVMVFVYNIDIVSRVIYLKETPIIDVELSDSDV